MSDLAAGTRLRSAVCSTEVVVIRAPAKLTGSDELRCGGRAMFHIDAAQAHRPTGEGPAEGYDAGTQLGKRYADESGLELLCTKGGAGSLSLGEKLLEQKGAKPLPSSD